MGMRFHNRFYNKVCLPERRISHHQERSLASQIGPLSPKHTAPQNQHKKSFDGK
jgi:hypothetical protein